MLFSMPSLTRVLAQFAAASAFDPQTRGREFNPITRVWDPRLTRSGPGRKTLYTLHKKVGRSKYVPHQGSQERFRRWKRMELALRSN